MAVLRGALILKGETKAGPWEGSPRDAEHLGDRVKLSGARHTHLPPLIAFFPKRRGGGERRRRGAWKEGDPSFRGSSEQKKEKANGKRKQAIAF